jgi:hypothetical protein
MIDVGLHPWDFTRWSYYHSSNRTFFLEEDVDMGTFITSYIAKYGEQPKLIEQNYNYDCYVRSLDANPIPRGTEPAFR